MNNINYSENDRLNSLKKINQTDLSFQKNLNDLVFLAAQACNAPIALISFIDEAYQIIRTQVGTLITMFQVSYSI